MKKTNRTFKRFAAITSASLLAACMVAPMAGGFTSSALEAGKIKIINQTSSDASGTVDGVTHQYDLYQIFTGNVTSDNISDPTSISEITEIGWAMTDPSAIKTALATLNGFAVPTDDTPAAYAKAITTWASNDATKAKALAQLLGNNLTSLEKVNTTSSNEIECTADGYYIIVETTATAGANASKTYHLLGTYDKDTGADIYVKASKPTVEKKVKEDEKCTTNEGYNDVADYSIGENVPFRLTATLSSNISVYDKYYLKFTDELEAGFDEPTGFTVKVDDETVTLADGAITVTAANGGGWNIIIEIVNLKNLGVTITDTTKVVVDYTARLNEVAEIGRPGNYNDVYLEYSNNPNNTGNGTSAPSNDDLGKTDKDGVVVFTYQLDVHKYDSADTNKELLANASFVLIDKANGKYLDVDANGDYVWQTITETSEEWTVAQWEEKAKVYTSTAEGVIQIKGLDDGEYQLKEIAAPGGFNKLANPIEIEITATTDHETSHDLRTTRNGVAQLTKIEVTADEKPADTNNNAQDDAIGGKLLEDGNVMVQVANSSGTALPGTGGIGTTIFYLGGGAMAAIGGIYLISKRRMKKSEE